MLQNALIFAGLTFIGMAFIYAKLPDWARRWIKRRSLLFDITACIITYIIFGQAVTALIAAAMVGILVSAWLWIAKRMDEQKATGE